jgi:spore coat protein JC
MWSYEKKLQYPVRVNSTNPRLAKMLITQYGGPDGELAASLRYLNQRYTMPTNNTKALLTDIGTEEMAHLEIIATMVYKLLKNATKEQIMEAGYVGYFDHGKALFYMDAAGNPWTATYIQAKDDPIADLTEDMDAEQKARATYNHLMDFTDDPGVLDTLRFLRQREVVHFQRFGEALVQVQQDYACKKVF